MIHEIAHNTGVYGNRNELEIIDRTKIYKSKQSRITFEDHKSDLQTKLQTIHLSPINSGIVK